MAGFYALTKLMAPIPRGATALKGVANTDMATAVFKSDGQGGRLGKILVAIVNDLDVKQEVTVRISNAQVADGFDTSVWARTEAVETALLSSVRFFRTEQGISVSVVMPIDSLVVIIFTRTW